MTQFSKAAAVISVTLHHFVLLEYNLCNTLYSCLYISPSFTHGTGMREQYIRGRGESKAMPEKKMQPFHAMVRIYI